ncbi:DUF397 domain-containing protein [Streptomyces netropsis]|uniref:DUF397 domain-containing protein n=1 Tax=Streptomyces netropsis TaxID=55404 RepID=A0A7W7L682_STRNE|nr:DUF397 domain-containing protein [Streptomyces netropsis]MBB4884397.1 hypothetical protein [Streptomyces netropsis]GGR03971.1 hypothetical protein GCM10010219_05150 [Streptomyces netropsis]
MQSVFRFRKSSFSNPEVECVEIATNIPDIVAIRDSKIPEGPIIRLAPTPWNAFREALVTGAFNR